MTNTQVVAFNAAGLGNGTSWLASLSGVGDPETLIRNYDTSGEIVSDTNLPFFANQLGNRYVFEVSGNYSSVELHYMERFLDFLQMSDGGTLIEVR